jgi:hypothetical protein
MMRKRDRTPLRQLVALLLGFGWATTVFAAQIVGADMDLVTLPWLQIGLGCALSLWGGLTRSAERALESRPAGAEPFRLTAELRRDFFVSSSCGLVTFLLGAWQQWNVWMLGLALWAAGYIGARFLAAVSDAILARVQALIQAGPTDKTPPSGGN